MVTGNALIRGRYQLGRLIGSGGMGNVYVGADTFTGETVAIKELRPEPAGNLPALVERFLREGDALRRLNHPNIVKVLATAGEGDQQYIVMEYVGGGSVADLLRQQPALPLERVVAIGLEVSDALSRAHHLHILHRDIKPANILLAEDGTPRLTDFGLARFGGLSGLTEAGSILGTFHYLSPEAVENQEINERSDIWSFGVTLFEMLTGRLPFTGETPFEIVWAIKNQPLPSLEHLRKDLPPEMVDLIRRMLRKDNPARVNSVRQIGAELERIQKGLGGSGILPTSPAQDAATHPTHPPKIRVVIVDDHAVVRQGLRMFINLQEDMEVVGEGSDGREAIDLAGKVNPDIVLLDLVMPNVDGVQATTRIKAICPQARVLILTSFTEDDKVIPAIQAGAQGYLLKDIQPDELVRSIRAASQGKTMINPEIAQKLVAFVAGNHPPAEKPQQ